jgi:hypothetical protein
MEDEMEKKLWFDGKENHPVQLVEKVGGGWIVRLPNGMLVGPVKEDPRTLR